jgi:hypothetical protein
VGLPVVPVEDTVRVKHGDQLEDVFATQYSSPGIVLSATIRCITVSLSKFLHSVLRIRIRDKHPGSATLLHLPVSSSKESSHLTADKEYFSPDQLPSTRVPGTFVGNSCLILPSRVIFIFYCTSENFIIFRPFFLDNEVSKLGQNRCFL